MESRRGCARVETLSLAAMPTDNLPVRKFSEEEVALIIKRAAELQQTEAVEESSSTALTLAEVEQIAKEAGIDASLVRRAAVGLNRPAEHMRPSPFLGAPTRIVFERVVDGEISNDEFESIVNETRRTFGDNGVTSVLGRTVAWSSMHSGGRRRARGRQIDVSVAVRGGVTTIRVEEELRNIAGGLFGGLVGGGGWGTTGISVGLGMSVFHSAAVAALMWVAFAGGFYALARGIYGSIESKREEELRQLANRLEQIVADAAKIPTA